MNKKVIAVLLLSIGLLLMAFAPPLLRERIAIYAKDDSWIVNGFDIIWYTGDLTGESARVDGASGSIHLQPTAAGTATPIINIDNDSVADSIVSRNAAGTPTWRLDKSGNVTSSGTETRSGNFDLNGNDLIIDADADSVLDENTDDNIRMTLGATAGTFSVLTGSLKIGDGSPGTAQDGEDAYVEGNLEVDGTTRLDGGLDANGTADIAGNITDSNSAVTFADNVAIAGAADANQLVVTGYTTQTNSLQVWEQSGGADVGTLSNAGALDVASTVNYGSDNLYPLGYVSSGYEIECGTTSTFTASTTIAATNLTTITVPLAIQVTAPTTTAAYIYMSDPTTSTVTLTSLENDFSAGTTGIQAHYCLVGNQ